MAEHVKQLSEALRIIRLKRVVERTGLSRSSIYQKIAGGEFPRQIALSTRAVGFVEQEVDAWIAQRILQSRKAA